MGDRGGEAPGSLVDDVNDPIYAELTKLVETKRLTPDDVVLRAKNPQNAMHKRIFGESEAEAAHQRRLDLARELISEYVIEVRIKTERYVIQEFVRDPSKPTRDQGYIPVKQLKDDPDLAYKFLSAELTIAAAYVKRARDFAVVLGLVDEFELLDKQLQELRSKTAA